MLHEAHQGRVIEKKEEMVSENDRCYGRWRHCQVHSSSISVFVEAR